MQLTCLCLFSNTSAISSTVARLLIFSFSFNAVKISLTFSLKLLFASSALLSSSCNYHFQLSFFPVILSLTQSFNYSCKQYLLALLVFVLIPKTCLYSTINLRKVLKIQGCCLWHNFERVFLYSFTVC